MDREKAKKWGVYFTILAAVGGLFLIFNKLEEAECRDLYRSIYNLPNVPEHLEFVRKYGKCYLKLPKEETLDGQTPEDRYVEVKKSSLSDGASGRGRSSSASPSMR